MNRPNNALEPAPHATADWLPLDLPLDLPLNLPLETPLA